ncbi:MAG: radical SAM protein [Candidatus Omnitrophota bacterium]
MKLLLLKPQDPFAITSSPSLSFAYLASIAEERGWQVCIINASTGNTRLSCEQVFKEAMGFSPDLIGVSILTFSAKISYDLIKRMSGCGALIIAGGPHATVLPEEVLIQSPCDIVVRGEGEETFAELLDLFEGKKRRLHEIRGISFKDKQEGRIIHTPDRPFLSEERLNALPLPAKNLFLARDFQLQNFGNIAASRGCPFSCTFCSQSVFHSSRRQREADSVFREIEELHRRYGVHHISFVDDVFTINEDWVRGLCAKIEASGLPLTWRCFSRVDSISEGLLRDMKKAGCIFIIYGVESINPYSLKKIKKKITTADIKRVLLMTRRSGIGVFLSLIWGFPWETIEETERLLEFINEVYPFVYFFDINRIVPFPGTELYNEYYQQYGFKDWWLRPEYFQRDLHLYQEFRNYYPNTERPFFPLPSRMIVRMEKAYSFLDERLMLTRAMIRKCKGKYEVLNQERVSAAVVFRVRRIIKLSLIAISKFLSSHSPELELRFLAPAYKVGVSFWRGLRAGVLRDRAR